MHYSKTNQKAKEMKNTAARNQSKQAKGTDMIIAPVSLYPILVEQYCISFLMFLNKCTLCAAAASGIMIVAPVFLYPSLVEQHCYKLFNPFEPGGVLRTPPWT